MSMSGFPDTRPKDAVSASLLRLLITLSLCALFLFVPLYKGGVYSGVFLAVSLLLWFGVCIQLWLSSDDKTNSAWFYVWCCYTGVICFQLFIIPHLVSWNSPPIQGLELDITSRPVNFHSTLNSWLAFNAYWGLAYLSSKLSYQHVKLCLLAISIALVVQISLGLYFELSGTRQILGLWEKSSYLGSATGTFVNHNHFANFIAITLPLVGVYLFGDRGMQVKPNSQFNRNWLLIRSAAALLFLCFFCLYALLESKSRMGLFVGLIAMWAALHYLVIAQFKLPRVWVMLVYFLLAVFTLMISNFLGIIEMLERYQRVFGHDMRWDIWSSIFNMPMSVFIWGSGAGTFSEFFSQYHPAVFSKTAHYAHNEYLQFLTEYGLISTSILLASLLFWIKQIFTGVTSKCQTLAFVSIIIMLIHCVVDFNLHIPANALIFWFSVGLVANKSLFSVELK